MDTKPFIISWLVVAVLLIAEFHCGIGVEQDAKSKEPPDRKIEENNQEVNVTSEEQTYQNSTDAPKKIGNLDDAGELLGQETIQSELNDISTTTTVNPKFRKLTKPILPYYPTRYLFRLKPSLRQNNRISLKIANKTVSAGNNTVSDAMLKWRSRYNYIFRRRGSTPKPSYLTNHKNNYLIGSESSNYSSKLRRNSRNRYRGRRKKARNYSYVSRVSNGNNRRYRSSRRNSRSRYRRRNGLKTSGSSTSYISRRYSPNVQVINSNVAVPGEPIVDYPAYQRIPKTSFTCQEKVGNFPDYEARCQLWHMCYGGGLHSSFLCPNGTLFNQKVSVCDWWYKVRCESF